MLEVGDLSTWRDFIHVDDGAEAYRLLAEKGERGGVYNLASGQAVQMRDALRAPPRHLGRRRRGQGGVLSSPSRSTSPASPATRAACGPSAGSRGAPWTTPCGISGEISDFEIAMKILVTGGTGFLGRRVVAELADRHALRLLVRRGSSRERFPAGVEFAEGDVTDRRQPGAGRRGLRRGDPRGGAGQDPRPARASSTASTSPGWRTSSPRPRTAGGVERHALRLQLHGAGTDRRPAPSTSRPSRATAPGSTTTSAPRPSPTARRARRSPPALRSASSTPA